MPQATSSSRLVSLDALRGFDMCWILGMGGVLKAALDRVAADSLLTKTVSTQLEHAAWEGFRFYDFIFPLFLFIAGVSMAIALPRRLEREGHAAAVRHLLGRALILCVLEAADGKWLQMSAIRDVLRRPPSTVANLIRAAKLAGIVEHRYEKCPRGHRHLMVRLPQEVEK